MNDRQPDDLDNLLQEWRVTEPLPPRFRDRVWRRIESANTRGVTLWEVFKAWTEQTFARPAVAIAYVSVLVVVGTAFGVKEARDESARVHNQLSARYVQALDPYQSPNL